MRPRLFPLFVSLQNLQPSVRVACGAARQRGATRASTAPRSTIFGFASCHASCAWRRMRGSGRVASGRAVPVVACALLLPSVFRLFFFHIFIYAPRRPTSPCAAPPAERRARGPGCPGDVRTERNATRTPPAVRCRVRLPAAAGARRAGGGAGPLSLTLFFLRITRACATRRIYCVTQTHTNASPIALVDTRARGARRAECTYTCTVPQRG